MSTVPATVENSNSADGPGGPATSPPGPVELMARLLSRLQREYAVAGSQPTPWAAATMAALRKAEPGRVDESPATWPVLYATFPDGFGYGRDEVSPRERAAHATLVLYAVHQASQGRSMHATGLSLGRALHRLIPRGEQKADHPVVRRFSSLITAGTFEATVYHLRGLMTLLRREGIPLDHNALYRDLVDLQDPRKAAAVRRRWGRDFFNSSTPSRETAAARPEPSTSGEGAAPGRDTPDHAST